MSYKIPLIRVKVVRDRTIRISSPCAAVELANKVCGEDDSTETMAVIGLDGSHTVRGIKVVGQGGAHHVSISSREILLAALDMRAPAIILAHNHPSGSPIPSEADILFTRKVSRACNVIGILLLDHIIVTGLGREYHSMLENEDRPFKKA